MARNPCSDIFRGLSRQAMSTDDHYSFVYDLGSTEKEPNIDDDDDGYGISMFFWGLTLVSP